MTVTGFKYQTGDESTNPETRRTDAGGVSDGLTATKRLGPKVWKHAPAVRDQQETPT